MFNLIGIFGLGFTFGFFLFFFALVPRLAQLETSHNETVQAFNGMKQQLNKVIQQANKNEEIMLEWIGLLQPITIEKQEGRK